LIITVVKQSTSIHQWTGKFDTIDIFKGQCEYNNGDILWLLLFRLFCIQYSWTTIN